MSKTLVNQLVLIQDNLKVFRHHLVLPKYKRVFNKDIKTLDKIIDKLEKGSKVK